MISIIVSIFNVRRFLRQCIESLICQSLKDIEIILVDDGSTDGSASICGEYAEKDPRITVIHKVNGGLVSARKEGLRAARGQYIAFVDGDDWVEIDMYERMQRRMEEQDVDIVMCGRYEDTGSIRKTVYHTIPEGRYGKESLMRSIYPQMVSQDVLFEFAFFPMMWDKLYRRECVERFELAVDERITMGEDAACVYPCILNVDSIFVMHECLYHYRQTPFSMIKKIPDKREEQEKFRILFRTVNASLGRYAHIYDLRQQWKRFMLFLMIPRADGLYQGYGELGYLFPFPKVRKGACIVLYCAGTYGQRLYKYLQRTGFCQVVAWVDRDHEQLRSMGLSVEDPQVLQERDYDAIVIANMSARSRQTLYQELAGEYPEEKIHMLDEALIFSEETMSRLGLIDIDEDLVAELDKYLREYDRIFLSIGDDGEDKELLVRFCSSKEMQECGKKILILSTGELVEGRGYVYRRLDWEEAIRLKSMYMMYGFSDRFRLLSKEGRYGNIMDYVKTGVLTWEEAFVALLY